MQFELLDVSFTQGKCIIVPVWIQPNRVNRAVQHRPNYFILDTGATSTHISKNLLALMGYKESVFTQDSKKSLSIRGIYTANLCQVRQLSFCDLTFKNCTVKVWEPPKNHRVEGVIGMDILRRFNININMDTGRTVITRSQATFDLLAK